MANADHALCTEVIPSNSHPRSVFDKDSADLILMLPSAHQGGVISLSVCADGSTVASIGQEGKVGLLRGASYARGSCVY
jgi:hypothetical protein